MKYSISYLSICVTLSGCFQSEYTRLVKAELAKGVRNDSLLFGIRFGDTRNEFYGKCFDLNKQQLVTAGAGNNVEYVFSDSLFHRNPTNISLLFYPSFDQNDKIINMKMQFSYRAWAPWNRDMQSDSLLGKTEKILMNWYGGNNFILANVGGKQMPVKLDGNRRILVYTWDMKSVSVEVQDILNPVFKHASRSEDK
ncbi:MAG: hypothetical protein ING84_07825 [Cytophagales bacterium]|nr:hypothetical protein [Cytophagales bacterium]MCA6365664.1 hypothetical protein [Cytophagales bacterium]MCA6375600.1 hypothetical protein [Cytophagales bacterium]MCA6385174.1 hypothetical protein [Cytophagales bacterium]